MLLLLVVLLGPAEACPERLHHLSLGRGVQLEVTTADLLLILLRDSCTGACHLIHRQKQHRNHEPSATPDRIVAPPQRSREKVRRRDSRGKLARSCVRVCARMGNGVKHPMLRVSPCRMPTCGLTVGGKL